MSERMTPEQQARVNQLITDTFGIGRREWKAVSGPDTLIAHETLWYTTPEAAGERFRSHMGDNDYAIESRLAPLDFCGSLDAVRQVEESALETREDRCFWLEALSNEADSGGDFEQWELDIALATAEQRALALLRWKGVEVPE